MKPMVPATMSCRTVEERWETKRLSDIASIRNEKVLPSNVAHDTLCVELDHIETGSGQLLGWSSAEESTSSKFRFVAGDVLFGRLRSYLRKYWHADREGICTTEIWPLMVQREQADSGFLHAIVQSFQFNALASISYGTHMPRADWEVMSNLEISVPPIAEQRAIAKVLSDMDDFLGALDALIAKKQAVKQTAMQQLLTCNTRLPGFDGEWETKRLGDIASFYKGSGLSKKDLAPDGKRRCIHYGQLFTIYGERITKVVSGTNLTGSFFLSRPNDVLMPASDVTPNGLATASCILLADVILGGDVLIVRPSENTLNGEYLAYVIKTHRDEIMRLVSGTTVFHLYGRDLSNFRFSAPSVTEQTAITKVLADMDTEIAALECSLDKTRDIKHGILQQLLSGRVRLVKTE